MKLSVTATCPVVSLVVIVILSLARLLFDGPVRKIVV